MFDFMTIGGATRDIFLKVDGAAKKKGRRTLDNDSLILPYGEKLIAKETFYSYGGGAANSAVCLSRLGAKVGAVCNIGSEGTGSLLISALKNEGINTDMVGRDKKNHTGLSIFILGEDNEHTGFLERGANNYLKFSPRKLKKTRWLYVSSLTGESAEMLPQIFEYARANQIKIAFNPGSQQLCGDQRRLERYISQSEIIILNMEEAEEVLKKSKRKIKNKRNLLIDLSKLGAGITLVTDAKNGSHAVYGGKIYSQVAIPKKVSDTTGAGDSFGATFTYGIANGHDIMESLKMAAINSASVVSVMGAQDGLLSLKEIKNSSWL